MRETVKLEEIRERTPALLAKLVEVWEASVKATHHFLSEGERERIKTYVPLALQQVERLLAAWETPGKPLGFLGVSDDCLEMLFLSPQARGKGLGRRMLQRAIDEYGVTRLTVNQQNPQAVGFYLHLGFQITGSSPTDEQGGPYPLYTMSLPQGAPFPGRVKRKKQKEPPQAGAVLCFYGECGRGPRGRDFLESSLPCRRARSAARPRRWFSFRGGLRFPDR